MQNLITEQNKDTEWNTQRVGDITEHPQYGWTTSAKKDTSGLKLLRTTDISSGVINWETVPVCVEQPPDINKYLLKTGDILISRAGSVGLSCFIENPPEAVFASYLIRFRAKENIINNKYLYYYFQSPEYWEFIGAGKSGIAVPNVNATKLADIEVKYPVQIKEQLKIVNKLDLLLPQTKLSLKKIQKAKKLIQKFRQSVLNAAVTGKLTEDWREANIQTEGGIELLERIKKERHLRYAELQNNSRKINGPKPRKTFSEDIPILSREDYIEELPESWTLTNVGYLAFVTKLAGFEYTKYIKLADEGEVPVIRAQNVQMGRFVEENIKFISKETSDLLDRSQLYGREILMVFIGAGTGNVCMAPQGKQWHLAPNVAKIDVNGIDTEYLYYYLQSPVGFKYTTSWIKATAQPSLSMETIRKIIVPIPPLEEQKEIVKQVKKHIEIANNIEDQIEKAEARVSKLTQAILAKTFIGES